MCLITPYMDPIKVKNDLTVYKILTLDLVSPYEYFAYKRNKLYKTEMEENWEFSFFDDIDSMFINRTYPGWEYGSDGKLICIGPGFHSAFIYDRLKPVLDKGEGIFRCIIPKGATMYRGVTNLCVSDQIIIKALVDPNKKWWEYWKCKS